MRGTSVKLLIAVWTGCVIAFLYVPMVAVVLASFSKKRYFSFPIKQWDTRWYEKAFESLSVRDLFATSLSVALLVTLFSVLLAFCGALAEPARHPRARHQQPGRHGCRGQ